MHYVSPWYVFCLCYIIINGDGARSKTSCSEHRESGFDTKTSIYRGACNVLICVDGNGDFCYFRSQVQWLAETLVTYCGLVNQVSCITWHLFPSWTLTTLPLFSFCFLGSHIWQKYWNARHFYPSRLTLHELSRPLLIKSLEESENIHIVINLSSISRRKRTRKMSSQLCYCW